MRRQESRGRRPHLLERRYGPVATDSTSGSGVSHQRRLHPFELMATRRPSYSVEVSKFPGPTGTGPASDAWRVVERMAASDELDGYAAAVTSQGLPPQTATG